MNAVDKQYAAAIGAIIKGERKRRGLTQFDIAQIFGISQSAISKIESGLLVPSATQWFEFCAHLGVSPDSFLGGDRAASPARTLWPK